MSTIQLRPYQSKLITEIYDQWRSVDNVAAILPTGGGKTMVFGSILKDHAGASCAIAHRRELVGQMSVTLARLGVRHRIVAPDGTIREIVTRHMQEVGQSFYNANSLCAVAGVDTLVKRKPDSWMNQVSLWVGDECFPAGTLVSGRPIEEIKVGDFVEAFDERTGEVSLRRVARTFKNAMPEQMLRILTKGQHVLECTSGHPFWTKKGWVPAIDLRQEDEVLSVDVHAVWSRNYRPKRPPDVPAPKDRAQTEAERGEWLPSHRSGRALPRWKTQGNGCKERRVLTWTGLDSIEIYESRGTHRPGAGDRERYVYNIEVDELHTYVANGVVVHNCHHFQAANKWGRATSLFPNAKGLGVTATFTRADGKGLGRCSDGVFDAIVEGPNGRWLINEGFLADYRIFQPESDMDLSQVPVSETTGDFNLPALRIAAKKSHIVGDVVDSYLRIAPGKLGITFCVSVDIATDTAARFRSAGIPAEVVSAETPELQRAEIMRRFARRQILQLVNVDLLGEGLDVPGVEVVSMARPTMSYGLCMQQFGRALRPKPDGSRAIIIDHVGNILGRDGREGHGLPDKPRIWSLDRRERKSRSKDPAIPQLRACPGCTGIYERFYKVCPYCGFEPIPASRRAPEHVDGDLCEVDPDILAKLRGEVARIDGPARIPQGLTGPAGMHISNAHRERQRAQNRLRHVLSWWGGLQKALGRSEDEGYRRFYLGFGIDVLSAQALNAQDADTLTARVAKDLELEGVQIDE